SPVITVLLPESFRGGCSFGAAAITPQSLPISRRFAPAPPCGKPSHNHGSYPARKSRCCNPLTCHTKEASRMASKLQAIPLAQPPAPLPALSSQSVALGYLRIQRPEIIEHTDK